MSPVIASSGVSWYSLLVYKGRTVVGVLSLSECSTGGSNHMGYCWYTALEILTRAWSPAAKFSSRWLARTQVKRCYRVTA